MHEVSRSHTTTHHSRQDSSGRVASSSQRPLPDNTQQSQQTNIHAPGGIRTPNPSRRAAVDLRLRPRGHWDRLTPSYVTKDNNERSRGINLEGFNPYPTAFPYGNGMILHFYQQQESSTTKTIYKVINKRLKTYV